MRAREHCSFRTRKHCSYVHEALFARTRKHCSYVRVKHCSYVRTILFMRTCGYCSYTERHAPIGQNEQEPDRSQREKAGLLYIYL
jgi:hypothetical protein